MGDFVWGFIAGGALTALIGTAFVWGIIAVAARQLKDESKGDRKVLLDSNLKANAIALERLEQQKAIAARLEDIADNMTNGRAKVQEI